VDDVTFLARRLREGSILDLKGNGEVVLRADTFDRADSNNLGTPSDAGSAYVIPNPGPWPERSTLGGYRIIGNLAGMRTSAAQVAVLECGTAAVSVRVTHVVQPTFDDLWGLCIRYVDAENFIFMTAHYFTGLTLERWVAGVRTALWSSGTILAAGDRVNLAVTLANVVSLWVNDVLLTALVETACASGTKHGLYCRPTNGAYAWDDLTVTEVR
jgi:hypothetical protein